MKLAFEKWEGLGNDFILVRAPSIEPSVVRKLCERRFGVGADGVLLVDESGPKPRMILINADGSRPEMCGNGLRCVAAFLDPEGGHELVIATDAGDLRCFIDVPSGDTAAVEIVMGVARRTEDLVVAIDGREHVFSTIDIGNPHAISFEPFEAGAIDRVGPVVSTTPPRGINVHLARATAPRRLDVVVWERGVGKTLACGTGACAVAAVACDQGRAPWDEPVTVGLPGGDLQITVARATREVRMRGPARRVFVGEVVLA